MTIDPLADIIIRRLHTTVFMEAAARMQPLSALVIDDDRRVRQLIGDLLKPEGIRVLTADNPHDGLHYLQYDSVGVVLTDLRLPAGGGMELLRESRRLRPAVPVILITGYGSIESAVEAMREGACDYVTKPITRQKLLDSLERASSSVPTGARSPLASRTGSDSVAEPPVVARSSALCSILKLVEKIAPTKASVLIQGETGVGKEVIAQKIHYLSSRRNGPFVRVNCGAIPESLFESELFGHERGAFTGAEQRRAGCFELAHGGTIFLDEVGELPRRVQVRLLHALQDGRFRRVGGTELLDVDMRVIAATNRDLELDVQQGRFRRDLYFRVNVVSIRIPPLRERPEDSGALVEYFLQRFAEAHGKATLKLSAEVINYLLAHDWPGNARELSNVIERAVIMSDGEAIELRHLPDCLQRTKPGSSGELIAVPLAGNLQDIERHVIHEMIARCQGNKAEAARRLGMHRRTLYRVLQRKESIPSPCLPQNGSWVNPHAVQAG